MVAEGIKMLSKRLIDADYSHMLSKHDKKKCVENCWEVIG